MVPGPCHLDHRPQSRIRVRGLKGIEELGPALIGAGHGPLDERLDQTVLVTKVIRSSTAVLVPAGSVDVTQRHTVDTSLGEEDLSSVEQSLGAKLGRRHLRHGQTATEPGPRTGCSTGWT